MRIVTRPIAGSGRMHSRGGYLYYGGCGTHRPMDGAAAAPTVMAYTQAGPAFKGMDPSDPMTYTRPWNPQPGMIAQLNFDGAQLQGRTPTQLQRGAQARRPRRLRVSP